MDLDLDLDTHMDVHVQKVPNTVYCREQNNKSRHTESV